MMGFELCFFATLPPAQVFLKIRDLANERTIGQWSAWNWMGPDPTHDLIGALVWWEDWIEQVLDSPVADDQRQAL
jgi:hypothetical protein